MNLIQRSFWGHLLLAAGGLAAGYALSDRVAWLGWLALGFVILAALWFAGQRRGLGWIGSIMLYLFLVSAGVSFLFNAPGWLLLIAGVATLGAWDLDHFLQRLNQADQVDYSSGIGVEHLKRLAVVEGLGLVVGLAAIYIHTNLPFWGLVGLVLVVLIGIRSIIIFVRKEAGQE